MRDLLEGKSVLVTGGAGSIGSALVKKIMEYKPKAVRALDINETGLFNLRHNNTGLESVRLLVGDIRDRDRLGRAVEDIDIIFHAAAMKHVSLCELNPFDAIQTNVLGTKNLIEAALDEEVDRFITISTDKAVNPVNVLGASKLLAERLTVSANLYKGARKTIFSCVRFGNVLNSQGSVLPLFRDQIRRGGPVTITDEGMTRFVMSIEKATELVLKAAKNSLGGEIFILKMEALRIKDLAHAVIAEIAPVHKYDPSRIKMELIGKKHGEKLYEELLNEYEAENAHETEDMFILSPNGKSAPKQNDSKLYESRNTRLMAVDQIRKMLRELKESGV